MYTVPDKESFSLIFFPSERVYFPSFALFSFRERSTCFYIGKIDALLKKLSENCIKKIKKP